MGRPHNTSPVKHDWAIQQSIQKKKLPPGVTVTMVRRPSCYYTDERVLSPFVPLKAMRMFADNNVIYSTVGKKSYIGIHGGLQTTRESDYWTHVAQNRKPGTGMWLRQRILPYIWGQIHSWGGADEMTFMEMMIDGMALDHHNDFIIASIPLLLEKDPQFLCDRKKSDCFPPSFSRLVGTSLGDEGSFEMWWTSRKPPVRLQHARINRE